LFSILKIQIFVFYFSFSYRIRRKLDSINNVTRETEGGKRGKKSSSKPKEKEKIIQKVEESIEKILNIDDIDETPFMEYFRRTSSYIFFGLLPTAQKSICLLPLPVTFSFCNEDDNENIIETSTTTKSPKQTSTKKLRTKKEKRAKQFIHSRPTRLDSTDEKIDDPIKPLSKTPTATIEKPQSQKKQSRQRLRSSVRRNNDEQIKHFDEEEQPVKKLVGVESKKAKNKKRFQIIGQEVKIKQKHSSIPLNTNPPPSTTTIPSTPVTTTNPPPIVTTSVPVVQTPKTNPSHKPEIVSTTTPAPLRTISEIIQEEATTLLSTKPSFFEESKEEINEANEILQTTTTTTTSPSNPNHNTASGEEDNDSAANDSESNASDNDSNSNEEAEEKVENYDPAPIQKMKQFYENAKESVHDVFDLKNEKDSS